MKLPSEIDSSHQATSKTGNRTPRQGAHAGNAEVSSFDSDSADLIDDAREVASAIAHSPPGRRKTQTVMLMEILFAAMPFLESETADYLEKARQRSPQ